MTKRPKLQRLQYNQLVKPTSQNCPRNRCTGSFELGHVLFVVIRWTMKEFLKKTFQRRLLSSRRKKYLCQSVNHYDVKYLIEDLWLNQKLKKQTQLIHIGSLRTKPLHTNSSSKSTQHRLKIDRPLSRDCPLSGKNLNIKTYRMLFPMLRKNRHFQLK